jgi:hypothetical protein
MNGIRTSIAKLACVFAAAAALQGATSDYFPLQVGNSWVYRVTQGRSTRPASINVEAVQPLNGADYYRVNFFDRIVYLRYSPVGSVLRYDPETKQETLWLPLSMEEGVNWRTDFDPCSWLTVIESKSARVQTVLGSFDNALYIRYTPNCADAGTTQQYFLPYVGMILYETTSIAGPVRHELVYSKTGLTSIVAETNAFALAVDKPVYKAGENTQMLARVTLHVTQPVTLTFPSGQNSDLRILNEKGESVYTWSADKLFIQVFREEKIGPGERNWVMDVPLGNLAPGKYTAEGWLTTQPRQYSAVVSFEIVR